MVIAVVMARAQGLMSYLLKAFGRNVDIKIHKENDHEQAEVSTRSRTVQEYQKPTSCIELVAYNLLKLKMLKFRV